jgi:bacterioferritin-associated ferredoxin
MEEGALSIRELKEKLKVTESCGCCLESVKECLSQARNFEAA